MPLDHFPGDIILDRYLRDADRETREAARERWAAFVRVLLEIAMRQAYQAHPADSPKQHRRLRIQSHP